MTNNEKLKIVQKAFKLKANEVAVICFCSSRNTVTTWRSKKGTGRYRNMPNSKWVHLERYLIEQCLVKDKDDLDRLLKEHSKQLITEDD